jgi:hypothetical protein
MGYKLDQPIILSSVLQESRQDVFEISNRDVEGASARWSVRKFTLHGGKQEGVELVEINNGKLRILVALTRGMSVLNVQAVECRLGWDSPIKEVIHPHFIDRHDRGGLGWLEGFNEWLVRCGLEYAGSPGRDRVINNAGDEVEVDLTLHGKIANTPASHVEVTVTSNSEIRLCGQVYENTFLGPKLSLRSCLTTPINSEQFVIEDTVANGGASPQEFQLIYHTNFGTPLLEEGASLVVPARTVAPLNARADSDVHSLERFAAPQAGFTEQVYLMELYGDAAGRTGAMLKNKAGDMAATMQWKLSDLPCFTLWKNLAAEADGYVTGLEPGTSYPFNRSHERLQNRVPLLPPFGERRFELKCSIERGQETVANKETALRAISGGQPCTLMTSAVIQ